MVFWALGSFSTSWPSDWLQTQVYQVIRLVENEWKLPLLFNECKTGESKWKLLGEYSYSYNANPRFSPRIFSYITWQGQFSILFSHRSANCRASLKILKKTSTACFRRLARRLKDHQPKHDVYIEKLWNDDLFIGKFRPGIRQSPTSLIFRISMIVQSIDPG